MLFKRVVRYERFDIFIARRRIDQNVKADKVAEHELYALPKSERVLNGVDVDELRDTAREVKPLYYLRKPLRDAHSEIHDTAHQFVALQFDKSA